MLGNKYSILAAGERAVPLMENMVNSYHMEHFAGFTVKNMGRY